MSKRYDTLHFSLPASTAVTGGESAKQLEGGLDNG